MSLYTKKEILNHIKEYDLPMYPISGLLAYTIDDRDAGGIIIPSAYKKSAIRAGNVIKGVVVSTPINCEEEPGITKEKVIYYKAASGYSLNINGHTFHKLELPDILAIEVE